MPLTPTRMAKFETTDNTKYCQGYGVTIISYAASGEYKLAQVLWKVVWQYLLRVKTANSTYSMTQQLHTQAYMLKKMGVQVYQDMPKSVYSSFIHHSQTVNNQCLLTAEQNKYMFVQSYNGILHINLKKRNNWYLQKTGESHKLLNERNKIKSMYDTVYTKFKDRQNKSMLIEVLTVFTTLGWEWRGC